MNDKEKEIKYKSDKLIDFGNVNKAGWGKNCVRVYKDNGKIYVGCESYYAEGELDNFFVVNLQEYIDTAKRVWKNEKQK